MPVVTRFAPSPTGFLHIGGARTALFNWLYARHTGGVFHLRVEDTDRERSTPEAVDAILRGLTWLGLEWDGEAVFQSQRADRHRELAEQLLAAGKAYRCYCTAEELTQMRDVARAEGRHVRYDGRWRDRDPAEAPAGVSPAIRFRAPEAGETIIDDQVQGQVRIDAAQLDDMILLRSDGLPTYMLAVVADDHDMEITHVIRGVDHLTNAARQTQLFLALGWDVPVFAHIPLIHGPDGGKLSKRHGALAVEKYRDMGFLPEAMRNYLARLGWSHGDDEVFSTGQAIDWFGLEAVGRSAARFDFERLRSLNAVYLRESSPDRLLELTRLALAETAGGPLSAEQTARVIALIPELTKRIKDTNELAENAAFLLEERPLQLDDDAATVLTVEAREMLARLAAVLEGVDWAPAALEEAVRSFAETESRKLGEVAQPLRAALSGRTASPGIFEVLGALGREESLGRLEDAAG